MKKLFTLFTALLIAVTMSAVETPVTPGSGTLNTAISAANAGDVLVLSTGDYSLTSTVTITKPLTIKAVAGESPVIKPGNYIQLYSSLCVKGIKFDCSGYSESLFYTYVDTVSYFKMEDCVVTKCKKYTYTTDGAAHVDSVYINNCHFYDNGRSIVYIQTNNTKHGCFYLSVKNSTLAKHTALNTDVIRVQNNQTSDETKYDTKVKVEIDHVTFYNCAQGNYHPIAAYYSKNVHISNCIFANGEDLSSNNPTYCYGSTSTISNCLTYHLGSHHSGPTITSCKTQDPVFADSANLDFHLGTTSPALRMGTDGTHVGDPRWWNSYARTTTIGNYGTICLPYAVAAGSYTGATFYSIAGKRVDGSGDPTSIVLEEVTGDLVAGRPYIFQASAAYIYAPYIGAKADAGSNNGLIGSMFGTGVASGKYVISSNQVAKAGTGCKIGANKAYIDMASVPVYGGGSGAPGIREIPLIPQSGTSLQNVEKSEKAVKFFENGKLLIEKNGVVYDVMGTVVR